MVTRIATTVALLSLVGGPAIAQNVVPKQAAPKVTAQAVKPMPVPAPFVVPDPVALEEMARHAVELADLAVAPMLDLRVQEELALAKVNAQTLEQDVQQKLEEARLQFTFAQTGASYDRGTSLLDRGRYDEAIKAFDGVIKGGGSKVEGAYYWKAYAQNRLGQRSEALATLDAMLKAYANGRWANDARALQVEVKQASGQPVNPDQTTDDEIKLIALNSIVRSQPEQAVAIIEKMLAGTASPRVKERALLVLSQASTPRAKELLLSIAKGKGNPDLQMKAIEYFGNFASSDPNTIKQMVEIYRAVSDVDVKKRVIRSLATQGRYGSFAYAFSDYNTARAFTIVPPDRNVVVTVPEKLAEVEVKAKTQMDERAKAREARAAESRAALWQIYQGETEIELKKEILRSSILSADAAKLIEVVRAERNPELRQTGIRGLGMSKDAKAAETLLAIYREDKDPDVRKSVIDALSVRGEENATTLVQLARQEKDPAMRRALVERLSHMKAKAATDYMMELLGR